MVEDYLQTHFMLGPLQTCGVDASLIGVFAVFTVVARVERIVSDREPVLTVSCVPATLTATATATQLQLQLHS